jgi:hypothetical protein
MSEMIRQVMEAIAPGCFSELCSDVDRYEVERMARAALKAIPELRFSIDAPGDWRVALVERENDFVWKIERVR